MRRIHRLQRPCAIFTPPPTIVYSPLRFPQVSASASARCISSTSSVSTQPGRFSQPTPTPPTAPKALSVEMSKSEVESQGEPQLSADESKDLIELVNHQYEEPTIPLPPRQRSRAPKIDEVMDVSYQPAGTAKGLPEVMSTNDWFADDENWDILSRFVGFAPSSTQRVQDLRVLEVLLRRALVEALVMKQSGRDMIDTWGVGGRDELVKALGLQLVITDGKAEVQGDVAGVLDVLDDTDKPTEEWDDGVVNDDPTTIETGGRKTSPFIESEEAGEICKGWEKNWKDIVLDDIALKFGITKRIYQLTGHRIHDYKLHSILSVGGLLKVLQSKPKSTKLFEVLEDKPVFAALSNVKVHDRRITPIDKEKMVGRWKVIERELEKRSLPSTGHKHLPKPNQRAWILGKA